MKYLMILLLLVGCEQRPKKEEVTTLTKAMNTQKQIFELIELADTKAITKDQLKEKATPLQENVDSMRIELSESETKIFDDYKQQLFDELIDRKVARDNPK